MSLRQREPREHLPDYMAWVARLPCVACLCRGDYRLGVHVAHVRSAFPEPGWREVGKAEKPHDWRTLPLCPDHHLNGPEAQHRMDETDWWSNRNIYPPAICAELRAAYENKTDGAVVIARFAARARKEAQ